MLIQTFHGRIASKYERILVMNVKETGTDWKLENTDIAAIYIYELIHIYTTMLHVQ